MPFFKPGCIFTNVEHSNTITSLLLVIHVRAKQPQRYFTHTIGSFSNMESDSSATLMASAYFNEAYLLFAAVMQ